MRAYYKPGDWNAICQVCGFAHKASELRKRWDGLLVCSDDYEFRNPQDLIRIPTERSVPLWTSPEATDVYLTHKLVTQAGDSLMTEGGDNLIW